MREPNHRPIAGRAAAIVLALVAVAVTCPAAEPTLTAHEPISFVLPVANFQPIPNDAYPESALPPLPPQSSDPLSSPPAPPNPDVETRTENGSSQPFLSPLYEPAECETCNCEDSYLPPGLMPNGQYPDNWLDRCGGSPYRTGPGTCDNWKVGPIWDVTVDGMVMTREHTDLAALQAAMAEPGTPEVVEQFDRGPGGRVFLTGLLPKHVGYQVLAGYEGIEDWDAAIVYPVVAIAPPPTTERRSLFYTSNLHSGEINILRMCNPAWRPYCGPRYIKFDDEIWDQNIQNALPPLPGPAPVPVVETDTFNVFDMKNELMGFQGGLKYDLWQFGRRFSLQGYVNSGVYYNKAKWSNLTQTVETQFTADDTDTPVDPSDPPVDETSVTVSTNSNLTIVERSDVAFVGEASLTAVCRLNKCWACRAGYQALWIDGVQLADDAYLGNDIESRSLLFHGWHAGIECRR